MTAAISFCPSFACAWGGEGHQIIALVAEAHLTDEAKAGIHGLLGDDADISDAEIASWADEIKRERGRPSTATWHYVNIPVDAAGYDAKRESPKTIDIVEATSSQIAAVADKSLPIEKRAEALKFIVHLIGDLHQPLHCADRGDRGGNSLLVYFLAISGKPSNLHSVWDTAILKNIKAGERVAPYAEKLNAQISDEQIAAWTEGNLIRWANEGHGVAREHVYDALPAPATPQGEMLTDKPAPITVLDQAYVDGAKPVIELQMKRGGLRLASVLNKAFANASTGKP